MNTEKAASATLLSTPGGLHTIAPLNVNAAAAIHLSIVLPTYNESKNIREMVSRLTRVLDGAYPGAYEIIVVDDDSPDRTWELAQSLTDQYPQLRVMRRQQERGLSTAVIRGWQAARGELLGVIDADLQHPPEIAVNLCE
jgi:dolichol-phosphate mannosyltransferase